MILYQYPGADGVSSVSPPCSKVEMALRLLGAKYDVENVNSPFKASKASPTGRLPVLKIEGERIADSIVILDALERKFPDSELWPNDPARRLQDRLWDHFGTDTLYWYGVYCRWVHPEWAPRTFKALFGRRPWYMQQAVRLTFLPRARRRATLHGVGSKSPQAVEQELERALMMIDEGLCGGPFLQGRRHPGRGDIACASLLVQLGFRDTMPGILDLVRARPALPVHVRRVLEACEMEVPNAFSERF